MREEKKKFDKKNNPLIFQKKYDIIFIERVRETFYKSKNSPPTKQRKNNN